jgi:hypothetical protein
MLSPFRKETHVDIPLERRGLLGIGGATVALLAATPLVTQGKKKRKKKGKGGGRGFSRLQSGPAQLFSVEEGGAESGTSPCPANTLVISGGYLLANDACRVVLAGPVDTDFSAWEVTISCPEGEESVNNAVAAICIS